MKKWITRIALGVLGLVLLLGSVALTAFLRWRNAIMDHLEDGSTVVVTSRGPVEYATLGEGRPVLYLHGSPGGFDQVSGVLRAQYGHAGPGFRAILPSRPGYLRTPLSTGRTPAEQADAMAALLDVLNVQRAAVVGISDGGPSALQFALRHPRRCAALILWSAVTQRITGEPPLLFRILPSDFMFWAASEMPERALPRPAANDPTAVAMIREIFKGAVPYAKRKAGKENDSAQDAVMPLWPLHEIRCPTLIVHGTRDGAVPFSHAEAAHAQIVGSRLVRLEGGHLVGLTKHKELDAAMRAFLAEHETHAR